MLDRSKSPVAASPHGKRRLPEHADVRFKRLKAEGNWKAFCVRKQSYRDQGSTPAEADVLAHHDFPPPGLVETSEGYEIHEPGEQAALPLEGAAALPAAPILSAPGLDLSTPDIRRDAYWAYNHIGVTGLVREDAPSQGAWNMLRHFGHNGETIRDFLEEIAKPLLKGEPKGESYSDDGRELISLCERTKAGFLAVAARDREEAA